MRKLAVVSVLVLAALGVAGFAFAGPWGWGGGRGMSLENVPARIETIRNLDLTDAQVDSIQGILQESFAQMRAMQETLAQKTFELRLLFWQKSPDQAAIEAKIQEINVLRQQMMEQRQTGQTIHDVLTPEQQESLKAANQAMRGPFGRRGWMKRCPPNGNQTTQPTSGIIR